jgi:hypothetical protein
MTMKPPPAMAQEYRSVTPMTLAAATAASTALPPLLSISMAAAVARTSMVAAAPPRPVIWGVDGGAGTGEEEADLSWAQETASSTPAHAAGRSLRMRSPRGWLGGVP